MTITAVKGKAIDAEFRTVLTDRVSAKRAPKTGPNSLKEKSIPVEERDTERKCNQLNIVLHRNASMIRHK
jgi:hypothetical protein